MKPTQVLPCVIIGYTTSGEGIHSASRMGIHVGVQCALGRFLSLFKMEHIEKLM